MYPRCPWTPSCRSHFQRRTPCRRSTRHNFSKVLSTVASSVECTRALTFENVRGGARVHGPSARVAQGRRPPSPGKRTKKKKKKSVSHTFLFKETYKEKRNARHKTLTRKKTYKKKKLRIKNKTVYLIPYVPVWCMNSVRKRDLFKCQKRPI